MKKLLIDNMKKTAGLMCSLALLASCSDWDDHFSEANVVADMEVYSGDVVSYLRSTPELSEIVSLYENNGVLSATSEDGSYTFIVADNGVFDASQLADAAAYAKYTVADAAIAPSMLTNGYGINTRSGKSLWVYRDDHGVKLDDYNISKSVKADNGYVYYVDGVFQIRRSVYEMLTSLPDDQYSRFKEIVQRYEEKWFDRENSTPVGVNNQGQVVYDSVWVQRNTLLDRYSADGVKMWDMFDEQYNSTVFIPTNDQIDQAINTACDNIPLWLNREPTPADTLKFENWIAEASFVDHRLYPYQVSNDAEMITCVGNCQKVEDKVNDVVSYKTVEPAYWNPQINTVDAEPQELSNGFAYNVTSLKIPNHIVIYRVKSRFYELWNNMTSTERNAHFTWTNWQNPYVVNDAQGQFDLVEHPTIYYHVLTAEPTQDAIDAAKQYYPSTKDSEVEKYTCGVVYDGVLFDEDKNAIFDVRLPAGEYYLRMGFKHSLTYSLTIEFRTKSDDPGEPDKYPWVTLKKDMVMYATGSNFHFDRGAASEVPHYGDAGISYPEGYDVDYWQKFDEKAIAYDTDGYTVGIVNIEKEGNFEIRVSSSDMAYLYRYSVPDLARTKSNVAQLMMYHWCLRPTVNNY
ncbi:MAG: hypothetical protein IJ145_00580 [Prevotella sp.]|nr:hypothetical protein [Prevotella sp.]